MSAASPHFLLYAESYRAEHGPRWKFVLQSVDSEERLSAADSEQDTRRSRLELLAVVRGLEAIDCPSRVTLLTRSAYVVRGIRRQLAVWRANGWRWERFGTLVPIRDQDLWQRVDRALGFHTVECCSWHVDEEAADRDFAQAGQRRPHHAHDWPVAAATSIAAAIGRLRRGVLTPLSALWRPAFTQAA
jgi:ribonuclease HI